MTNPWDDPDLAVGGDYIKFDQPGTELVGTIRHIGKQTWSDGSVAPQLLLSVDGEDKTLTASQTLLKLKLQELRPAVGETIRITYIGAESRAGGKTLKHFEVERVTPATKPAGGPPF
jgi:hypothetical protein